jgi:hypothetical protein
MMKWPRTVFGILGAVVLVLGVHVSSPAADPLHTHCDFKDWPPFTINNPTPTVVKSPGGTFKIEYASLLLPVTPPLSTKSNCFYETSDITKIDVTLSFFPQSSFTARNIRGLAASTDDIDNPDPSQHTFGSRQTESLLFPAHLDCSDAFHVTLPNDKVTLQLLGIDLVGMFGDSVITPTGTTLAFSGNHYYRTPEPSSLLLAGAGIVAIGVIRALRERGGLDRVR